MNSDTRPGSLIGAPLSVRGAIVVGSVGSLVLLFVIIFVGCGLPPEDPGDSIGRLSSTISSTVPNLLDEYDVPGVAISLLVDGEPVWADAFGYADPAERRRMEVGTICRAESISKSVTAWGVMSLVEDGLVRLDEPVARYVDLGFLDPGGHSVADLTVGSLLTNTGGLPLGTIGPATEFSPGSEIPSLERFVAKDARLTREPGEGFSYSDVGFNLLEMVVQEVAGRDFAHYMQGNVLVPLGMNSSSFDWQPEFESSIAFGHERDGAPVAPYVYPARASGGLFSNVEDLARFVAAGALRDGATGAGVLSPESVEALYVPRTEISGIFGFVADYYGYGYFVETLPDGSRAVWHGGQGHGWMSHFHFVPDTGDGIVVLANSQRSWPLMAEILSIWSHWAGIGPVKFSRLVGLQTVLRLLVVVLFVGIAIQVSRLFVGYLRGRRRADLTLRKRRFRQGVLVLAGLFVAAFLGWRMSLPYVFETSIFPVTVNWMAGGLAALSITFVLTAIFPRKGEE